MNSFFQPQNPLWRHIQRYATTAVLFPASTKPQQPASAVIPNQPIVQAVLPEVVTAEPVVMEETSPTQLIPNPVPVAPAIPPVSPTLTESSSSPVSVQTKLDDDPEDDGANWNRLQAIIANHRAKRAAEEEAQLALPDRETADLVKPTPPIKPSVPGHRQTTGPSQVQRTPSSPSSQPLSTSAETEIANLALPSTPSPEAAPLPKRPPAPLPLQTNSPGGQPQPDSSPAGTTTSPSVPLEAAWPVQRVRAATAVTPSAPADEAPLTSPITAADEQALQTTLNEVEPGQPTDSAIDFNPPRRPRPTAVPPQAVQRQPKQPAPQPEMVPTEIGPLPADLWQLLDQEPPASSIPLVSSEAVETSVAPSDISPTNSASVHSPLPELAEPQSQSKPVQLKPMATGAQPDALPRISQPEERSAESQNVVQRWSDNNPLLPDLAAVDPDLPFASLLEAPTMNPPMATPPMSIPEIIDNGEPPPLPPFVPTQQLPQLAQPELPGTLPLPDALPSMPQIAQPELPNTLPPLSAPNLPTGLDTSQPGSQLQDLAQSSLPNGFPTLSAPDLPITPDTLTSNLPSLENGTVVAANISDLPDELSPLEALLGQDDTADETTINEIARQVYRHLKRRLDVEWERTRNRR